eukprot:TRINITY_DN2804_c0_g1_i6.p1 TRINITY_DN2804_c0_g1~~TRINITY_DN2804_c0_g1_i6.p1  ORF type:complete len:272 (+),score=64.19 TRINITY_DN2804_c0_g1_i6:32-817(+)
MGDHLSNVRQELGKERILVGMVGYPNVGKSSTINVLARDKRVAVSATPGKTRHYQTIKLNEEVTLCDCPGLVFPTFMSSRADLVCNGVLPIDQLKVHDYVAPISLLCQRVSREQLRQCYGLTFPMHKPVDAHSLLAAYGKWRGYWGGHGHANEPKSARYILKDFVNGKLRYCHPPPSLNEDERKDFFNSLKQTQYRPEPEYKELADNVAVQEYLDEVKPQTYSRAQLKGNTKAKARLRRQMKMERPQAQIGKGTLLIKNQP